MNFQLLHNNFFVRQIKIRPRLFIAGCAGVLVVLLLPANVIPLEITRLLIGWNLGACLYLVASGVMMVRSTTATMQRRACEQDDGQIAILVIVILAAIASLAAIIVELAEVKNISGLEKYPHILLAIFTILSSWAFTHMMFALHYAHDFYMSRAKNLAGGLDFPHDNNPDYGDFCYFAFIIGTSGQTADVSFTSKAMRRVGMVHCVLAFLFNTTVLALMINIAASLF